MNVAAGLARMRRMPMFPVVPLLPLGLLAACVFMSWRQGARLQALERKWSERRPA